MKFRNLNNTLIAACEDAAKYLEAVQGMEFIELFGKEGLRTLQQNARMWPMLTDLSKQVEWFGEYHKPEVWKHLVSAAYKNQVFLHGIGGGMVAIPLSTSKLNKREFSELIEAIYSFGSDEVVKWSEPALAAYSEYGEAQ